MSGFRLSKSELAKIIAVESAGLLIGIPGAGTAFSLVIKWGGVVLFDTAEVKIFGEESKYGKFLIEDVFYLRSKYRKEQLVYRNIPYVELVSFVNRALSGEAYELKINANNKLFRCTEFLDKSIEQIREIAFTEFKADRKITHDGTVMRLDAVTDDGVTTNLDIQRAKYSSQAHSNLIVDYKFEDESIFSIREHLLKEFENKLPPLDDTRLANTLGVAILVFYRDGETLTPFFVPRTKEPAVFNHGNWHCTASGAAEWPDDFDGTDKSFESFILDDLYNELYEEVGLLAEDLTNVVPLAICRELVRAGKPQLFFIGFTELGYEALVAKMNAARNTVMPNAEPTEVYRMPFFRFPKKMDTTQKIASEFEHGGFTSEGAASLFYALQFLNGVND